MNPMTSTTTSTTTAKDSSGSSLSMVWIIIGIEFVLKTILILSIHLRYKTKKTSEQEILTEVTKSLEKASEKSKSSSTILSNGEKVPIDVQNFEQNPRKDVTK
jgi:hypothetical protein